MPRRKIPQHAFMLYVDLGPTRSYRKVAERLGVSKRAVTARAAKERWQERLRTMARHGAATESGAEIAARHLRLLKLVRQNAVRALRSFPPGEVRAALRKLDRSALEDVLLALHEEPDPDLAESLLREYDPWLKAPVETF